MYPLFTPSLCCYQLIGRLICCITNLFIFCDVFPSTSVLDIYCVSSQRYTACCAAEEGVRKDLNSPLVQADCGIREQQRQRTDKQMTTVTNSYYHLLICLQCCPFCIYDPTSPHPTFFVFFFGCCCHVSVRLFQRVLREQKERESENNT
uniref:Uncharacterized protein n=1 Tax=Trypanosoma vivax (strain Y486) TaxID=1055687 RepID=G0TYI1_TRYVY|nr:hypothetical protein TVY486_0703620 [Trypanosoma vivax Y486]